MERPLSIWDLLAMFVVPCVALGRRLARVAAGRMDTSGITNV